MKKFKLKPAADKIRTNIVFNKLQAAYIEDFFNEKAEPGLTIEEFLKEQLIDMAIATRRASVRREGLQAANLARQQAERDIEIEAEEAAKERTELLGTL